MTLASSGLVAIPFDDRLLTAPTIEPLDIDEVKKQRRFSSTSLDTLFDLWIAAARQQFEEQTGLQLLTATRVFVLDQFPVQSAIQFNRGPVQSIESIVYLDSGGAEQTFSADDYEMFPSFAAVDTYPVMGGVQLVSGASWPTSGGQTESVRITYRAGYGSAPGSVPEIIRYALLQYVGAMHRDGEDTSGKEQYALPVGAQMVIREAKYRMLRTIVPQKWATV